MKPDMTEACIKHARLAMRHGRMKGLHSPTLAAAMIREALQTVFACSDDDATELANLSIMAAGERLADKVERPEMSVADSMAAAGQKFAAEVALAILERVPTAPGKH